MKSLYNTYLVLGSIVFGLSWMITLVVIAFIFLPFSQTLILSAALFTPLLVFLLFMVYWIQRYYSSIKYLLTDEEVIIEKGVYWKRKSFVPYNRITNIDIVQGPLARSLGLGTIKIQTAGFSSGGGGTRVSEAVILNIANFDELKDMIMSFVRGLRPVAVEAESQAPEAYGKRILQELQRIREALERG